MFYHLSVKPGTHCWRQLHPCALTTRLLGHTDVIISSTSTAFKSLWVSLNVNCVTQQCTETFLQLWCLSGLLILNFGFIWWLIAVPLEVWPHRLIWEGAKRDEREWKNRSPLWTHFLAQVCSAQFEVEIQFRCFHLCLSILINEEGEVYNNTFPPNTAGPENWLKHVHFAVLVSFYCSQISNYIFWLWTAGFYEET